jgi:hypothetical protein
MDKIIIALIEDLDLELKALEELQRQGVSPDHIKTFTTIGNKRGGYKIATVGTNPDDRFADMKSEIFETLKYWGVPKDDAFVFTEGVRRGARLIMVLNPTSDTEKITKILKDHGALDLICRKLFNEELKRRPVENPSPPFVHIAQDSHYREELDEWKSQHRDEIGEEVQVMVYSKPEEPPKNLKDCNLNE